ncbi:MAG TPA: MgtC/SapB family protein [Chromatiales bacterium]|nr:MgtC/SapB family protein [Chromatiales bacterium]
MRSWVVTGGVGHAQRSTNTHPGGSHWNVEADTLGATAAHEILLLTSALAIGLLIGLERGWHTREAPEGQRFAGVRSYGLLGLLGGILGLLSRTLGMDLLGWGFVGVSIAATTVYYLRRRQSGDPGITSLVAALLTFALGAGAVLGHLPTAAAAGVIAAVVLGMKAEIHAWVQRLEARELRAVLQLLVLSVVILPVLPDRGFGPWQALNPYEIWWMVVLIAGISFVGYFAMKVAGARRGLVLTALFAGLVSSTALTLNYARMAQNQPRLSPWLAAGVLLACGTMFPRVLLVATVVNAAMFDVLWIPMALMSVVTYGAAALFYMGHLDSRVDADSEVRNPLELRSALLFGALLAVIALLGAGLKATFGEAGVLTLAAVSGVMDVDAINLTLSRMSLEGLPMHTAALGVVLAAASNNVVKGLLALFVGGSGLGLRVFPVLLLSGGAGLLGVWLA